MLTLVFFFSRAVTAACTAPVPQMLYGKSTSCYCSQQVLASQSDLETLTFGMVNYAASLNPHELLFSSFLICIAIAGQQWIKAQLQLLISYNPFFLLVVISTISSTISPSLNLSMNKWKMVKWRTILSFLLYKLDRVRQFTGILWPFLLKNIGGEEGEDPGLRPGLKVLYLQSATAWA